MSSEISGNSGKKERQRNRILTALARANSKISIKVAATLLGGSTLLSALLGIYRDRLLNSMYLDTYKIGIDSYTVAFTIPDFMFMILVTGALSVTFIPVFNERLAKNDRDSAWQISSSMLNLLAVLTLAASILIVIFAPQLVKYVVAPGLSESGQALATSMMRVIAINPFLFAIASILASIQQAVGRFVFFALSPVVYNIGIIIGALWFTNGITIFGHQIFAGGIMGVALGVVLGAVLQLIISALGLIGLGFDYKFKIFWKNKGFRKILSLLPSRSLDQGLDYVGSMVNTNLASRATEGMAEGTIRAFNQANSLYSMPINLIGVAISTAAFPQMTERVGQNRSDLFAKELRAVLRVIIWISLPISAIAFFARGYIVSVVARGGNGLIAGIFGILCLAILLRSVYHIAARSFYAQQDSRTPMLISLVTIAITIALELWFVFGLRMGVAGIAWSQVIWAALEIIVLLAIMAIRIKKLFNREFNMSIVRMLIATAIMSLATYILVKMLGLNFDDQTILMVLPKLAIIGVVSLTIYLAASHILKLKEASPVISYLKDIVTGKKFISKKK
ncbi:murein biosynthesis integral membrane protein MurJ [Candidatus Saccharibacteria bacterium]|nr:murein biosynthesis integral membrane protein MurJ [Candidatus Saccharibacteria bacterium]MCL1963223.1 murein biosynthesis integral membrane protein MurJ [Candidatus Saccharibacteria bacterium]